MIEPLQPAVAPASVKACWANDVAALNLSRDLADLLDAPLDEVWFALYNAAVECPALLHSPEGWTVLARGVGKSLGFSLPAYSVRVH